MNDIRCASQGRGFPASLDGLIISMVFWCARGFYSLKREFLLFRRIVSPVPLPCSFGGEGGLPNIYQPKGGPAKQGHI